MTIIEKLKEGERGFEEEIFKLAKKEGQDPNTLDAFTYKVYEKGKSHITSRLRALVDGLIEEVEMITKEYPPNLKQEIWGGESGFPNTKIESPDVFGIKYVDGYNSAKQDITKRLNEIKNYLKEK